MPGPRTYDMNTLEEVKTSVSYLPTYTQSPGDVPEVTVRASPAQSWKFWAGLAVGLFALHLLAKSMKRAARHG